MNRRGEQGFRLRTAAVLSQSTGEDTAPGQVCNRLAPRAHQEVYTWCGGEQQDGADDCAPSFGRHGGAALVRPDNYVAWAAHGPPKSGTPPRRSPRPLSLSRPPALPPFPSISVSLSLCRCLCLYVSVSVSLLICYPIGRLPPPSASLYFLAQRGTPAAMLLRAPASPPRSSPTALLRCYHRTRPLPCRQVQTRRC